MIETLLPILRNILESSIEFASPDNDDDSDDNNDVDDDDDIDDDDICSESSMGGRELQLSFLLPSSLSSHAMLWTTSNRHKRLTTTSHILNCEDDNTDEIRLTINIPAFFSLVGISLLQSSVVATTSCTPTIVCSIVILIDL